MAKTMVAVAQLVESRIVIPVVVGSSPISHPKNQNYEPRVHGSFFCANDSLWSVSDVGRFCIQVNP